MIQKWANKFSKQADIFPVFQETLEEVKAMGLIQTNVPINSQPSQQPSQQPMTVGYGNAVGQPKKKEKRIVTKKVTEGDSEYTEMFSRQDQYTKIRDSWKTLIDNVKLLNDLIDGEDYRKYKHNDIIEDMIPILKKNERGIQEYLKVNIRT